MKRHKANGRDSWVMVSLSSRLHGMLSRPLMPIRMPLMVHFKHPTYLLLCFGEKFLWLSAVRAPVGRGSLKEWLMAGRHFLAWFNFVAHSALLEENINSSPGLTSFAIPEHLPLPHIYTYFPPRRTENIALSPVGLSCEAKEIHITLVYQRHNGKQQ